MIKQLRQRLIVASMLSLLIVLGIIMGSIAIINYNNLIERSDDILEILAENNGTFPRMDRKEDYGGQKNISLEIPYESRYFSVVVNESEIVVSVDTGKIAAVSSNTAIEYALQAFKSNKEQGFVGDYRYKISTTPQSIRIIFLDMGRQLETYRAFVASGTAISLIGLSVVFILITLSSKKIIKPVLESYEKQKRFITDAGHEIKTPLTIINADAQILEMDFGENEWLLDIQQQTKRLTDLSNDLTLLARMDEEQTKMEAIEFLLSDLVEELAQSFKTRAFVEGKKFEMKIEPLISINGNEKTIRQLVSILLDNALKYTDENGEIEIQLSKSQKNINLSVYNTTEYISKESTQYLFDRFYRTDKSRNSKTGGHGLGLSIAQAIVSFHKGKIKASTTDEKSLLIQVQLPTN